MITEISSDRLVVLSDLHLGNPFSHARRSTVELIEWASREGCDICVNGDGFDVAQVSMAKLIRDVPEVLQALRNARARGSRVYYVVGNHDIVFEHFLADWGFFQLAPFLNVNCAGARFRVEHGHLYDPFFVRFPRLYDFCTWLGGFLLKVHPSLYRAWIGFEKMKGRLRRRAGGSVPGIVGEPAAFFGAAARLETRGFDGIVFGHTHHAGSAPLPLGGIYLNPGSWMLGSKYVLIANGAAELRDFRSRRGRDRRAG
jgi:UDP-2,3-diacylglucosamine pyrophosphatase LpxH